MSVLFETSLGDLVIDLETELCPELSANFLKVRSPACPVPLSLIKMDSQLTYVYVISCSSVKCTTTTSMPSSTVSLFSFSPPSFFP
jgi:hypothetical protein